MELYPQQLLVNEVRNHVFEVLLAKRTQLGSLTLELLGFVRVYQILSSGHSTDGGLHNSSSYFLILK